MPVQLSSTTTIAAAAAAAAAATRGRGRRSWSVGQGQVVTKAEASTGRVEGWTAGGELVVGMCCQGLASTGTPKEYGGSSVVVLGR